MDETYSARVVLPPGRLRALSARRDGPGLLRLGVHLALLGAGLGLAALPAPPARLLGLGLAAVAWGLFFAPLHEGIHRTAFRTGALNDLVVGVGAGLHLFAPTAFRAFHLTHHRHTHDPALDPEIAQSPRLLGEWPRGPLLHALLLTGVHYVLLKVGLLAAMATGLAPFFDRFAPYVPAGDRRRAAWEARALILGWALVLGAAVAGSGLAWAALLTLFTGHAVLAPILMAEHHGLPAEGDILHRTRSVDTWAPVRWLYWNMSLHAEHHAWPSVPFHALPALRAEVADQLPERWPGYLAVHRAARR